MLIIDQLEACAQGRNCQDWTKTAGVNQQNGRVTFYTQPFKWCLLLYVRRCSIIVMHSRLGSSSPSQTDQLACLSQGQRGGWAAFRHWTSGQRWRRGMERGKGLCWPERDRADTAYSQTPPPPPSWPQSKSRYSIKCFTIHPNVPVALCHLLAH